MMIGDGERPLLLVKWRQLPLGALKPENWFERRFKRLGTLPEAGAPLPSGFSDSAWVSDFHVKQDSAKGVWYGLSVAAGLLVEMVTTNVTGDNQHVARLKDALRRFSVSSPDVPARWSLFGVSFELPVGYTLQRRHLYSGDIALAFNCGRTFLLVRQVYPARMAIERRSLERWLNCPPFVERRRPPKQVTERWKRAEMDGRARKGWRRLPSPLGWCNPRYETALAVVDKRLDRLLIAERQETCECPLSVVEDCIEKMNR